MSSQNPAATTWGDLLTEALQDSGAIGIGMIPLAEDLLGASARGIQLLETWSNKRWLNYTLVTYTVQATGQSVDGNGNPVPYTIGPLGALPTPPQISVGAVGLATRPDRIESAFFRQLVAAPNGPVDYPLRLLPSLEDYNAIRMKGLTNFSLVCYYQAEWPYGNLYVWPWPQSGIYALGLTVRKSLPQAISLAGNPLAVVMQLPFPYYRALVKNIAMEVRPKYGIPMTPGDLLAAQARDSLDTIRRGNTQIPLLGTPPGLSPRPGMYNIFSDQSGPA
jgi:hypothetical protein